MPQDARGSHENAMKIQARSFSSEIRAWIVTQFDFLYYIIVYLRFHFLLAQKSLHCPHIKQHNGLNRCKATRRARGTHRARAVGRRAVVYFDAFREEEYPGAYDVTVVTRDAASNSCTS
jgi:hypothetical protein